MTIQTIDQRIREQARKELRHNLDKAMNSFFMANEMLHCTKLKVRTAHEEEVTINGRTIVKALVDEAFHRISPKVEEKAVAEFMKKVDFLQDQIDELHSSIEQ